MSKLASTLLAIASSEGGGVTPTGTININSNGETNVTNYASANVNVQPNLETKSVTITENTTTTIAPTQGKDGMSSVVVTTNVSGGTDTRWQEIGYEEEPDIIQIKIDYAKQIMQNWDASITNRNQAFSNDLNLMFFPSVNTSNVVSTEYMFNGCNKLVSIGSMNLSNVNDTMYMFQGCSSLYEVGDMSVPVGTRMSCMFSGCSNLEIVGRINIAEGTYYGKEIFLNCHKLREIKNISFSIDKIDRDTTNIFSGCESLSNATLKRILVALKSLTNQTQSRKNLKGFGLSQAQAVLCATFDEWTDLANAGWTTGY